MTWFNDEPEYDEYTEREEIAADIVFENCRTEAFGAIRRAAEEARWYDRRAKALFNEITKVGYNPYATTAMAIRLAIRAAIGSPKA